MKASLSRPSPAKNEEGFTLLEVLIAMAILLVGVLMGVLPLQTTAMGMRGHSFQRLTAASISRQFQDNFLLYYATANKSSTGWWTTGTIANLKSATYTTTANACPAGISADCPNQQNGTNAGRDNQLICRNGTKFFLEWKSSVANVGGSTHAAVVWTKVSWLPLTQTGSYAPGLNKACLFYETSTIKYCNLGDTVWGCP